jgi:hypothetical protein
MHDHPGPLAISASLDEVLRLCRALAARDRELAAEARPSELPVLDLGAVHTIEAELGVTLADDVLVVLAARIPLLDCASGLRLDAILDAASAVAERAERRGFAVDERKVVIARLYQEPFAARHNGAHGGEFHAISVPRDGTRDGTEIFVDGFATTLGSLIKDKLADWFRDHGDWLGALHALAHEPFADPTFAPALVGELGASAASPTHWVSHTTFGRGRVVDALADGKLVIEFDTAGRKTLLARFVSEL